MSAITATMITEPHGPARAQSWQSDLRPYLQDRWEILYRCPEADREDQWSTPEPPRLRIRLPPIGICRELLCEPGPFCRLHSEGREMYELWFDTRYYSDWDDLHLRCQELRGGRTGVTVMHHDQSHVSELFAPGGTLLLTTSPPGNSDVAGLDCLDDWPIEVAPRHFGTRLTVCQHGGYTNRRPCFTGRP